MPVPVLIPEGDAAQALRIRRLLMGALSYAFGVVGLGGLACAAGFLPASAWLRFAGVVLALQLALYVAFRSGWNRRFRDPSLTALQVVLALPPTLYVLYHMEAARSVLLFMLPVPFLYATLALGSRALLATAAVYVAAYGALVALLLQTRPSAVDLRLELLWMAALAAVGAQIAVIGGYLSRLRAALRERNGALERAVARIEELARHDELTGAWNRRRLHEALRGELVRLVRDGPPFSVVLLDLDRFKQVNDTHGHNAGDDVLKEVARTLADTLREADALGRWGGEEFLAILPQTTPAGARASAERLREAVEALELDAVAPGLRITLSAGVAHGRRDDDAESLVGRADAALYRAKRAGRNRVAGEEEAERAEPARRTA